MSGMVDAGRRSMNVWLTIVTVGAVCLANAATAAELSPSEKHAMVNALG
ncbi:MAG: hypothetical protein O7G86_13585 [Gammaproteobacteria bacterium]|nr:hypothetical protein [Gammaproteobacteria bacterium]